MFEDTGESFVSKSIDQVLKLFKENYAKIVRLDFSQSKQDNSFSTFHYAKDISKRVCIDLNNHARALDLINLIRAKTFTSGPSLRVSLDGSDYYLRINIQKVER